MSDAPSPPSDWVRRFLPLIERRPDAPDGAVLDLACGGGRHVRLLRAAGYPVVAVDRDLGGVADLAGAADVTLIAADLEDGSPWPLGERRFAGMVVANYLHRPLFGALARALAPGGVLLYETFARGNGRYGRPANPDFLLAPGELLAAFRGLHVVAYEHGRPADGRPRLVQRLCAVKLPADADGDLALPP